MNQADNQVAIEYYTDPLCCWSWAFEPQWRRLRYEYQGKIKWLYRMAGMIPSWKNFSDPMYAVDRPLQMGPMWMEASQVSGQPIHNKIWGEDPPASSYPACIAVKCAALQSAEAEEALLRSLREAVMLQGKNIANERVLFETAQELESKALLDAAQLQEDYKNGKGQKAFREDLQKVRFGKISRFPALILRYADQKAIMMVGNRPYDVLLQAIKEIAPNLEPVKLAAYADEYRTYWGSITDKEKEVATQV